MYIKKFIQHTFSKHAMDSDESHPKKRTRMHDTCEPLDVGELVLESRRRLRRSVSPCVIHLIATQIVETQWTYRNTANEFDLSPKTQKLWFPFDGWWLNCTTRKNTPMKYNQWHTDIIWALLIVFDYSEQVIDYVVFHFLCLELPANRTARQVLMDFLDMDRKMRRESINFNWTVDWMGTVYIPMCLEGPQYDNYYTKEDSDELHHSMFVSGWKIATAKCNGTPTSLELLLKKCIESNAVVFVGRLIMDLFESEKGIIAFEDYFLRANFVKFTTRVLCLLFGSAWKNTLLYRNEKLFSKIAEMDEVPCLFGHFLRGIAVEYFDSGHAIKNEQARKYISVVKTIFEKIENSNLLDVRDQKKNDTYKPCELEKKYTEILDLPGLDFTPKRRTFILNCYDEMIIDIAKICCLTPYQYQHSTHVLNQIPTSELLDKLTCEWLSIGNATKQNRFLDVIKSMILDRMFRLVPIKVFALFAFEFDKRNLINFKKFTWILANLGSHYSNEFENTHWDDFKNRDWNVLKKSSKAEAYAIIDLYHESTERENEFYKSVMDAIANFVYSVHPTIEI